MRVGMIVSVILWLAGCNTPTPGFYGADARTVQVDGSTYQVFVKDGRAQAIRINSELRYRAGAETKVRRAIQQASGCKVVGALTGDPVVATARVACGGRPAAPAPVLAQGPTSARCELGGRFVYCDLE